MRIKPWLLTGTVAVSAGVALGIIIAANDPEMTTALVRALFWTALVLGLWGIVATGLLTVHMNLAQATWISLAVTAGGMGCLLFWRAGTHEPRLLGWLVLATLLVSLVIWWRLRHAR